MSCPGVASDHEAVKESHALIAELKEHEQAVIRMQRMVRGKLARIQWETLKMEVGTTFCVLPCPAVGFKSCLCHWHGRSESVHVWL